jgi:hypothetical protein
MRKIIGDGYTCELRPEHDMIDVLGTMPLAAQHAAFALMGFDRDRVWWFPLFID